MKNLIFILAVAALLTSCGSTSSLATLEQQYPQIYEEQPLSIVIMPPINQTNHAEAKDYFYTTLYSPLCEKGYYVYSPYLTMELFQQESAYDSELFLEGDLSKFRSVLGADAAMFTIIKDWRRSNVGGNLTVHIQYILRSTKTGQTLYSREGTITVDTSITTGVGGLYGALADVLATTINTAATDKVVAGRRCNAYVLSDLPAGKYSNLYGKDMKNPAGKDRITATVKQ
jgi:hypothetical protein